MPTAWETSENFNNPRTVFRQRRSMVPHRFSVPFWIGITLLGSWGQPARAQLPATRLDGLFPSGGSPGQSVEVTLTGGDLDDVNQLRFSHPDITAVPKMVDPGPFDEGKQPVPNQFVVTIKPDVPPGHYSVRCRGKYGLSGPRTFIVDRFVEAMETEPNNLPDQSTEIATFPASVNGQLNGGADVDWFHFTGQPNQRVLVECYAQRLDSPVDAVVQLTQADGKVLAESRRSRGGDPFLDVTLPSAGMYRLRIHEALYRGGVNYTYRLTLGSFPAIDFVFPPAGLPGSNEEYTIYGRNLPGGQPSGLTREGRPLEQLKTCIAIPTSAAESLQFSERLDPAQASLSGIEYRITSPAGTSNPVLMTVATAPLVREQTDNNTPQTAQKLSPPCEVVGQFYPQRDEDWYTFEAQAGTEYWIEAYSHRLGAATDPSLVIQRVEKKADTGEEQVTQVAWVDDVRQREGGFEFDDRHRDPAYKFTAPADGTYRIFLREGFSSLVSDPGLIYRLAVRPARPDYRLAAVPCDSSGAIFLRKGGREAVRVVVFRQDGFDGEISLSASGLPEGVTASETIIGPAANSGLLVLTADPQAAGKVGELQILGKSKWGHQEITRIARPSHPLSAVPFAQPNNAGQPSLAARLTDQLPIVVSDTETARIVVKLEEPKVIETARGGIVKIKYSVAREEGAGGNITGFPVGLPPNMGVPQVGMGGNKEGEFELRLQSNTPPGTYSFSLAGMLQGMNYSRNPEAAAKAKDRAERIGKIVTESQQKTQQAQQAQQQAQNNLNQSNNELNQATSAKATADQAQTNAATALKSATDNAANLKKQLDAKPEDAGLKQQFDAAQKTLADATKNLETATTAAATAAKNLEAAQAQHKAATEAKTKADQALLQAQQFQQQAQQEKQRADQTAQQLQQQANQRGYNLIVPSTPVTLKIAEYPIHLTGPSEKSTIKQGEKIEIPFKVDRLYGFNQNVNTQLLLPSGVGGLQIQNVNLAANQADGKIQITAQPTATPGDHTVTFRASLNFNGQGLTLDRTFVLSVQKVEPAK